MRIGAVLKGRQSKLAELLGVVMVLMLQTSVDKVVQYEQASRQVGIRESLNQIGVGATFERLERRFSSRRRVFRP